ncbi:major tail protein [Bacillus thuringiensis]|uniref:major tail protein n=1 Tax=Bacillus thuringiensis TaxID=1428 RepID=UPI0026E3C246|nr:major tail protein [Bacillus thuringiensis]MDO6631765.1 phage tail protein [Bacillus thuringiensis]MDO6661404.1 phage tail protein [Bacillus thuringiensis]MDO6701905.1 phage tail protein [Bacillus thuringiensis]
MNKVTFGLKNVRYAIAEEDDLRNITYGKVFQQLGAVELKLDPKGDEMTFDADDGLYYSESVNQGYEGALTIAEPTEHFRTEVLGEELDKEDKVLIESSHAKTKKIAMMFEFDGDVRAVRHLLYYVTVSRPGVASTTKGDKTEPNKTELKLVASPRPDNYKTKISTTVGTPDTIYNNWYNEVYEKKATPKQAQASK